MKLNMNFVVCTRKYDPNIRVFWLKGTRKDQWKLERIYRVMQMNLLLFCRHQHMFYIYVFPAIH